MLAKIRDILIIVNKEDLNNYIKLLGDGKRLGIKISYEIQNKPSGIPEAFNIGREFIKGSNTALILGDNFFYSEGLTKLLIESKKNFKGAQIFCYKVKNPEDFGVANIAKNQVYSLVEKPKNSKSNLAISGLYFFDKKVVKYSANLKKSKRNETEIIDVLKKYLSDKNLKYKILGRGAAWLDTGTPDGIFNAGNFVYNLEKRQGFKIACIEEIAYINKWINKKELKSSLKFYGNSEYSFYLKSII